MIIAGHAIEVKERAGGLLSLTIALQGATISELAMKLTGLEGVRVTRGPETLGGGRCFIAHCAGFKMVLSVEGVSDSVLALVSPTPAEVALMPDSELSAILAELAKVPAARVPVARPTDGSPWRKGFTFGKAATPLRRTALSPGAPLSRKTPLVRKTPLSRGKR